MLHKTVTSTDVRADRVTLEVCFSLKKYFCGEAILLLGFCGWGVRVSVHRAGWSVLRLQEEK